MKQVFLLAFKCLFISSMQAQNTSIANDSLALSMIEEIDTLKSQGVGVENIKAKYLAAVALAPNNFMVAEKSVTYLIEMEDYITAESILSEIPKPFPGLHNDLAKYYYFLGIIHLNKGWGRDGFYKAHLYFNRANAQLRKSRSPNIKFWSDVLNNLGHASIAGRGLSKYDESGEPFCLIHPRDLLWAHQHFYNSLEFNADNKVAQANLDTIEKKLTEINQQIPTYNIPYILPDTFVHTNLGSINIDSLNSIIALDRVKYGMIPDNYRHIINMLNKYDEVVLVVDISESMDDGLPWSGDKNKFMITKELSLLISRELKSNVLIGIITVGRDCHVPESRLKYAVGAISRKKMIAEIASLNTDGNTPLNYRLNELADSLFTSRENKKTVFLISDGMDTCNETLNLCYTAEMLHQNGIDLSVFSFILDGIDPDSDHAFSIYECMVANANGKIFQVDMDGSISDRAPEETEVGISFKLPLMQRTNIYPSHKRMFEFKINDNKYLDSYIEE